MNSLEELYNTHRKRYVNIMSSILKGDRAAAEDVVQEAFTRAWRFQKNYNPKRGKLTTWFNTILFNSLRDVQKEMRGQPTEDCHNISTEDIFSLDELAMMIDGGGMVAKNIACQTNDKHKRILELFFFQGYTSTEIAQVEERVSASNVTTVVNRFRVGLVGDKT